MKNARSTRIVLGTACLISVALVMGWFVGRYIPGEPQAPAASVDEILTTGSERPATSIVEFETGSTMELPALAQGDAHELPDRLQKDLDERTIESLERLGLWEREVPSLDVDVTEVRAISSQSFADYNPDYYDWRRVPADGTMFLLTAKFTNTSDERYAPWWRMLPTLTLWNGALAGGDDAMGAGLALDGAALFFVNPRPAASDDPNDTPPLFELAPGETCEIVLPFRVARNALADPDAIDDVEPSDFCLQTADYATGTIYRLWL